MSNREIDTAQRTNRSSRARRRRWRIGPAHSTQAPFLFFPPHQAQVHQAQVQSENDEVIRFFK